MSKVLVTGGFDPIHKGHIALFKHARAYGTHLVVGLNSDEWLIRKKGRYFMDYDERKEILLSLSCVDEVLSFNDDDDSSNDAIEQLIQSSPIIFCNGGDRGKGNVPEHDKYWCDARVVFKWGIGGNDKKNSSSTLLNKYNNPQTDRPWGYYKVLYEGEGYKVKELVINPHSSLSMQRHEHRSESWNLVSGSACVILNGEKVQLEKNKDIFISKNTWHKGINESDNPAHIIEIWRGKSSLLNENDIERRKLVM
jgi:D-beta-D-heptose 7-phosphate kinase/D-beta-D-heptose 1-phosphate adenosyltransferase